MPAQRAEPSPGVLGRLWGLALAPRTRLIAAVVAGALLLAGVLLGYAQGARALGQGLVWASLGIGMVYGLHAAIAVLREKKFDIDVLMVVAAGLSAAVGHPAEGALLLVLFTLAGAMEDLAMLRATREITALQRLMPETALRRAGDGFVSVAVEELAAGDVVRVRPGDRVPTDARVIEGTTSVDQSAMTGESLPREVGVGDELFAGTVNVDDAVTAVVLRPARESSLQKMLELVTRAQEQKSTAQSAIDRFESLYAKGVLLASVAVFFVWWLALGRPALPRADGPIGASALMTAITLLVVLSPCALVLATPSAVLAGIARGARGGVLFKGGQAIEALSRVRGLALDKTGTLTFGRPSLREVVPVGNADGSHLLALAAGLEADSSHPIAVAIREGAEQRGVTPVPFERIDHTVAHGLEGKTAGGAVVRLGKAAYVEALVPEDQHAAVRAIMEQAGERGMIVVGVAVGVGTGPVAGVIVMEDRLRPGAGELVAGLHAMGVRPVVMLTGDSVRAASHAAGVVGVDAFYAELLPEDKMRHVERIRQELGGLSGVGLVGDGVNDAPALAAADVGVAMGSIGTAAALESADVVIVNDSLLSVPWSLALARRVQATIRANLLIALGAMGVMGILTLAGSWLSRPVPLALGVVTHEGGTVLVVLNALRLLAFPKGAQGAPAAPAAAAAPAASGPAINAHEQQPADARGAQQAAATSA